jgi:exodeoxyribonuclease VII large subunit
MQEILENKIQENIYTVSQLSNLISNVLAEKFNYVAIKGEVSGYKHHSSGHAYFSIKDDNAVINAVCWRPNVSRLKFKMEDGLEVVVRGKISSYPARSNYQIIAEEIEVAGVGALMKLLEERKKKLAAEGLFDASRKRNLPFLPNIIGIVTSPTGAVIQDILHRLEDRFPSHVMLYPAAVQGEGAAEQVAAGIEYFNNLTQAKPDVIIVARGGGSIEDLWAFNEEIVVRAAANSKIPLISAVGHETDTTLIDFASDRRAPTPTAAAEMAVPVREELLAFVGDLSHRKTSAINRVINERKNYLEALARALISPKQMLEITTQRLDDISERVRLAVRNLLKSKDDNLQRIQISKNIVENLINLNSQKLLNQAGLLESYNHKNVLKRGFSIVTDKSGKLIKNLADAASQGKISIEFHDGKIDAEIAKKGNTQQGSLF